MLLNHTSGIAEYNFSPAYITCLLQHPGHRFTTEDYLKYIDGKPLDFAPGSRYSYRDTTYILLALLTDTLTGDHARVHGRVAYGHTGDGLGAGCELYYFPEKGVYVFLGINLGTVTGSPLHKGAQKALDRVMEALLE